MDLETTIALKTLATALKLADDCTSRDCFDRIETLLEAAGEDPADLSDRELIKRGEHERVSIEADSSAVVSLYYPLKSGTERIAELKIRRPKTKDLKKMDESKSSDLGKGAGLLAALCGRAQSEIEDMDAADFALCSNVIGFLQRPPRRTGSSC